MICKRTAIERAAEFVTREEDGAKYIEGYFAVFGPRYEMWDGAAEVIEPTAFDDIGGEDVRVLVNHDSTQVLGRTTAGTAELRVDGKGLWGRVRINDEDQDALNAYARVQRGDVSQCSFGFDILDETTEIENGATVWHIRKVKLYEVSVVTFPAYKETSVTARKKDFAALEQRRREKWQADMLARLKGEKNGTENHDAEAQH